MSLPIYQRVAVTDAGDVIPGAEYTVINENTGVAAPIYSDRTGATLLTAPYFADSVGTIQFYIAQGTTFRVAASGGVGTYTDRYVYGVAGAVLTDASGSVDDGGADPLTISRNGGTDSNTSIRFKQLSSSWYAGTSGSNNFGIGTTADIGVAPVQITPAGNVGIGTASPGNKFVVAEGTNQHGVEIVPGFLSYIQAYDRATSDYGDLKIDSKTIAFGTNNGSERMRITADGRIGIGTASPTQAFSLVSTQNNNAAASILHNGSVIGNQYGLAVSTADDQNDTTRYFFIGIGGTTARFKVLSNGNVQNSNNSYGALSDQKLKENIADCASQWEDLKAVRLRNYSMISDRETSANRLGVIAQELEAAGMGGLVDESDDLDEKNESIGTTTKSVKYSILYMKAVGALQEAQTRIESLEELTQSLITRIEILEAK